MSTPEPSAIAVFIGAPGAGKSRIGKRVAQLLDVEFLDTDKLIVAEHGVISDIFEQHGEPHFRALEREAVERALASRAVVALGGGAVLHPLTQQQLDGLRVIQLTTSPEAVATRITNGKRPLLKDGIEAWTALVATRQPIYDRLATRTFDTSNYPADKIAANIAEWLTAETPTEEG